MKKESITQKILFYVTEIQKTEGGIYFLKLIFAYFAQPEQENLNRSENDMTSYLTILSILRVKIQQKYKTTM